MLVSLKLCEIKCHSGDYSDARPATYVGKMCLFTVSFLLVKRIKVSDNINNINHTTDSLCDLANSHYHQQM